MGMRGWQTDHPREKRPTPTSNHCRTPLLYGDWNGCEGVVKTPFGGQEVDPGELGIFTDTDLARRPEGTRGGCRNTIRTEKG